MKKVILLVLFLPLAIFAQRDAAAFKLGVFNPSSTDGGFIIGYEGGKLVDKNFIFGWSIDWFHKNYVDQRLVSEFEDYGTIGGEINELRAKTDIHDIPVMLSVTGFFPAGPRFAAFATAAAGAEVLLISFRDYTNPDLSEFKAAFDFSWRIGGGVVYQLGPRSELVGELTFHNSAPSWIYSYEEPGRAKRTFERVYDMSGMMFRVGARFYF